MPSRGAPWRDHGSRVKAFRVQRMFELQLRLPGPDPDAATRPGGGGGGSGGGGSGGEGESGAWGKLLQRVETGWAVVHLAEPQPDGAATKAFAGGAGAPKKWGLAHEWSDRLGAYDFDMPNASVHSEELMAAQVVETQTPLEMGVYIYKYASELTI